MAMDTGRLGDQSAVRRLTLDDVTFTYVIDGAMSLPPEQFLPAVPAQYWADHGENLDRRGGLPMSAGGLLVERGGRRLLIDAGLGVTDDVGVGTVDSGELTNTLTALGLTPADIDTVVFTHLHPDHTGWAYTGEHRTFPEARYVLAEAEWAPVADGALDGVLPQTRVLVEALRRDTRLSVVGDGDEVWPGVVAVVTPGHTPGHTSYVVSTAAGRRLVAFGDAFHSPAQMANTSWPTGLDTFPDEVPAARSRLLAELTAPDTIGFAFHFGDQPFGRVITSEHEPPRWSPVPSEALLPPPRQLSF
jgi:glyoxylase-like metal-dependent hydrolase (beta-lactamase superfamily II)